MCQVILVQFVFVLQKPPPTLFFLRKKKKPANLSWSKNTTCFRVFYIYTI